MIQPFYSDEELIANTTLHIYDYDIHVNKSMRWLNRCMPWYVMSFLVEGKALVRVNGREYEHFPGYFMFIPPNTLHDHIQTSAEPATFLWWHFDCKVFNVIDLFRLIDMPFMVKADQSAELERAFHEYMNVMRQEPSLKTMALRRSKMMEVLAYLFDAGENARKARVPRSAPDAFRQILQEVMTSVERRITLSELAGKYNLNATYLSNRFKAYYGMAPIAMHRQLQVERAKYLLGTQQMSVGEVAQRLGYSDPSVFSRFFTNKTSMAPSQVTGVEQVKQKR